MSQKPENPYAFPASGHPGKPFLEQEGMSLRDYFAAAALQGDLAAQDAVDMGHYNDTPECADIYANRAYTLADAMLKARAK